ncbi:c-type cytochrome [Paraburkholderia tropica]|uniref:c-type cytochrome n=1 Tax=Paraburkholderia tropica TaxID=92647 RepID=UPI0038B8A6FF
MKTMKTHMSIVFSSAAIFVVTAMAVFGRIQAATQPGEAIVALAQTGATDNADPAMIAKGRYLATAGDCIACHTAKGGRPFAGGLGLDSPIGQIYSTNITPDRRTGIGDYSYADFDNAIRRGIRKDGSSLYPAMPYVSYSKMRPSDVRALYAYFMHGVTPVSQPNTTEDIAWPLSLRWPLRFWRMAFSPEAEVNESSVSADPVTRGRYLVEGLAHCGACHTPRGVGFQELALTDDGRTFLSGSVIDGYVANNLREDQKDGIGKWTESDIVGFLKSGRISHSAAFGGMAEVVEDSTQHMSDADLKAIAAYLKTLAPKGASTPALQGNNAAGNALRAGTVHGNGELTFIDNCAACHRTSGSGYDSTFPKLALSSVVNADDPTSLIHIVLDGAQMPWTNAAPTHYSMPGFAGRLTDRDIADVLTFVRSSWGNHAALVSAGQVRKVRESLGLPGPPDRPKN